MDDSSVSIWKKKVWSLEAENDISLIDGNEDLVVNDFIVSEEIGYGRSCKVFRGSIQGKECAVKIITLSCLSNREKMSLKKEIDIMKENREFPHPNIAELFGIHQEDNSFYIFMSLSSQSLSSIIKDIRARRRSYFTSNEIYIILRDTSQALCHLHNQNIIHRDVKSHNVLINVNPLTGIIEKAILSDFGASKLLRGSLTAKKFAGTKKWMAPEIHMKCVYSKPVDIWSFGAMMIEILSLDLPYANINSLDVAEHIVRGDLPTVDTSLCTLDEDFIKYLLGLIARCLVTPENRPTSSELVQLIENRKELA